MSFFLVRKSKRNLHKAPTNTSKNFQNNEQTLNQCYNLNSRFEINIIGKVKLSGCTWESPNQKLCVDELSDGNRCFLFPSSPSRLQSARGKEKILDHCLLLLCLSLPLPLPFESLPSSLSFLGILKPPISFRTTMPRHQAWSWKGKGSGNNL